MFPGQGSQKIGMGLDLFEKFDAARELFKKADEIIGREILKIIFYGPDNDLNQTKNTQPAIFLISVLLMLLLQEELKKKKLDFKPKACCGHSLGEFSALWFAGFLSFEDLLKLVSLRGELMQNAPKGAMAAVLNLSSKKIDEMIKQENLSGKIVIANYNSPVQYVISGEKNAVELFLPKIKLTGGKVILLPVSGAFHSTLMSEPSRIFSLEVDKLNPKSSGEIPIFQNYDGNPSINFSEIKEKIKKQMTSSVLWTQTINSLSKSGIDSVLEIGPGKILTGLVKKINPGIKTYNIFDYQSLIEFVTLCESDLMIFKS